MDRLQPEFLLHAQFDAQARSTPERVAVRHGDDVISYGELLERAERVAGALRELGIGRDCSVGLHLERSIASVVGFLGILKTNAAVVPLPPSFPRGRLREILEFAGLDAIVDDLETPLPPTLPGTALKLSDLESLPAGPLDPEVGSPDQAAFVLCSSGSTGNPKMIVRSHRSFFHRLTWTWDRHPYADAEVCCQKAHMTTTHGIYELFEPLLRGAPVVIISDEETRNLEQFWDMIRAQGITRLLIVPSVLRASLDMPGFEAPALRVVVLMGEYVHPGLAGRAIAAFPAETYLCSIYGSTEASSTLLCELRESYRPETELPLGKPLTPDVRPLILGADLELVGAGEVGRLHMAGTPLFTEYFNDPELTATAFVRPPGQADPVFDTRDQVRSLPDGGIEYLGRVDQTVKIRGFRVDLPEVERAVLRQSGVKQAAAVVHHGETGNATLLAFYLPADVARSDVYETLREHLPDYMVPSVIVGLDEFPLTASAKLDRVRLLEEFADRAAASPGERELSDTERRVSAAWASVLGHESFGPRSSFFEVGGTSLTVFALVHRLRQAFDLDRDRFPEQSVYQYPSIEELAGRIDGVLSGHPVQAEVRTPLLVTLRKGSDPDRPPLFLVASAGGTLGAYEKLARALSTTRDIVGVRDPFIWGERDPTEGFQAWVARYVDAIRERQPEGPYYIGAYSSAGACGYEVAWQLDQQGSEVALLALIDPLALSRHGKKSFGWWALRATWLRPPLRQLVRLAGWLRLPALAITGRAGQAEVMNDDAPSQAEYEEIAAHNTRARAHLLSVSSLFELNTGLPFTLTEADFAAASADEALAVFKSRVGSLMPEVDPESIERILIQYGLQIRAQHAFQLRSYEGQVLLVEPGSRYAGLTRLLLRPHMRKLRARTVRLGEPSARTREISERFGALEAHYRSMRDDVFVEGLARELDLLLE
jgi:amino acid adenylation domain-containing protein